MFIVRMMTDRKVNAIANFCMLFLCSCISMRIQWGGLAAFRMDDDGDGRRKSHKTPSHVQCAHNQLIEFMRVQLIHLIIKITLNKSLR